MLNVESVKLHRKSVFGFMEVSIFKIQSVNIQHGVRTNRFWNKSVLERPLSFYCNIVVIGKYRWW